MNDQRPIAGAPDPRPVYQEVCPVCLGSRHGESMSESRGQVGALSGRCPYCAGTGYVVYEVPQQ